MVTMWPFEVVSVSAHSSLTDLSRSRLSRPRWHGGFRWQVSCLWLIGGLDGPGACVIVRLRCPFWPALSSASGPGSTCFKSLHAPPIARPSSLVSHLSGHLCHCSGTPDRLHRLSTHLARLTNLLAWYVDVAGSFRRRARSRRCWGVSDRIRLGWQAYHGPKRPQRLSAPPAGPTGLLALYLNVTCSYRCHCHLYRPWGLLGRCRCCLVWPLCQPARLARLGLS
jgi:hypothetical protein